MGTSEEPPARRENGRRRRRWIDGDDDDDEEYVAEEEEEEDFAEELSASSAGEEGEDSDAEYQEDEEEEEEEETPQPVKGGARRRKRKTDPATKRAKRRRYDVDDDYEAEPSEDEEDPDEDEEYLEETPRPKRPAKGSASRRKGKMDPPTARAPQQRYEVDDDYEEEPDEDDEELDDDEEFEEYHEEIEEEEGPPRPKSVAKSARRGQNVEPARSHRSKYEEDMDFEPELDDDEEEEVDEDIDFDPEVDDEDEEEEEFSAVRARKVTVKNPAKRKSLSKRQSLKNKKASKRSKTSKRKAGSTKSKKFASVKQVRKRFVVDDSDEDSEDDGDFTVDDEIELNQHPRKKARTGTSKQTELECTSVAEEGTWPNLESESSEFEFVTSDDEPDDAEAAMVEASTVRKGRKKRESWMESSSDSEFVLSDKELEDLGDTEPLKVQPVLLTPIQKDSITRHGEDKGKRKAGLEEAGKPICGICLSEEQRVTVQGVLNCCSHYFCFACIMEWSRVESRCPLCKQRFTTITKSSKSDLGLGLRKAIIKVEERDQVYQPTEEEIRRWLDPYENVACIECNQSGDDSLMLLCDICDSSAHTYCVGLGREVPEGNWYCGGCRLNDEGPSHARMQHTPGYERQSYRNHVDFSSVGFGVATQHGTCDRSSSMNRCRSFQGIDLNLSPREVPGEIHPAESQVSTDSVSTPTGRRATVSGRRQIHRYIRILLSRPRPVIPHNGAVPRTELSHHSFRSSSEANTSQIPDGIQNQRNGLPFAPSMPLDGDDFQHIEGVKSNLRNMQ